MPERRLSSEDVDAIVSALKETRHSDCRFALVEVEDLQEAVKFYKNFNTMMEDGKKTIFKTVLTIGVVGVIGLIALGFWAKINGVEVPHK